MTEKPRQVEDKAQENEPAKEQEPVQELAGEQQETDIDSDFEYKILKDREQRELLLKEMDKLTQKIEKEEYTNLLFLDRSARPLSTLFFDLWNKRFGEKPKPAVNFLNIGEEKRRGPGLEEGDPVIAENSDYIKRLKLFIKGGKCLIIDDLIYTGISLRAAEKFMQENFPEMAVETYALGHASDLGRESSEAKKSEVFLFENTDEFLTYFSPPWNSSPGIVGVVDDHPTTRRIFAKPTRESEKLVGIRKKISDFRAEMHHAVDDYWKKVKNKN